MTTVRQRSPNYPTVDLGTALADIRALYGKEQRSAVPLEVAAKALGYKSLSGPVRSRLAALKKYGLADQKKGGTFRLSERALTLVLRNAASSEYTRALNDAALTPPLFSEFAGTRLTSSDDALRHELIVNRQFTDDGANSFIKAFRSTMALARVSEDGKIAEQEEGKEPTIQEVQVTPPAPITPATGSVPLSAARPTNQEVVRLPLAPGLWATLQIPSPLTETEWRRLLGALETMKVGLVSEEDKKAEQPSPNA